MDFGMMNIKCVPLFGATPTRYAYVQDTRGNNLELKILDPMTEKVIKVTSFKSGKDFVASIPRHFNSNQPIQVAIFDVFDYENSGYDSVGRFIQDVRDKLRQCKVAAYFLPTYETFCSSVLIAANNVDAKFGERMLNIAVGEDEYQIGIFVYTKDGYKREGYMCFDIEPTLTLAKIMEMCELKELPKHIVAWGLSHGIKFNGIKTLFKPKPVTTVDLKDVHEGRLKYLCRIAPFILRNGKNSYSQHFNPVYFIPTLPEDYVALGFIGSHLYTLDKFDRVDDLPAKKVISVPRTVEQCPVIIPRCTGNDYVANIKFNQKVHRNELSIIIDAERSIKYQLKEIIMPEIKGLPKSLNSAFKGKSKIPVIGFFDNSSILCLPDKIGNYNFVEEWNGLYGQELFINFSEKQYQVGNDAVKSHSTKLESVVFDLIRILSMPADDMKYDCDKWKFTFTEDSNNPVLIEFDYHDGTKKAQSPQFLMALLLKEHNKIIKKKIGEAPKELGFCLFDQFTAEERKRIEDGLKDACKLIKQECSFIEF